jgi:hypothetical protein
MMASHPLVALNNPENIAAREPSNFDMSFITPQEAKTRWGDRILPVEGNTVSTYYSLAYIIHQVGSTRYYLTTQDNFYDTIITSWPSYSLVFRHSGMVSSPNLYPTATLTFPLFIPHHPQYTASFSDTPTQMAGAMIQVSIPISYVAHSHLLPSNTKKTGMIEY